MTTRSYGPLLDALRGVRWLARRAVGSALPGAHRSRQRGTSGEFTEYRLYRQGDDPRQIDWKLLARSDRTFVRLTDDRALLATWLVVDASESMNYPLHTADSIGVRSKWMVAQDFAIGLASVAHASGDPVGMVANGRDASVHFAARSRRGTVDEVARTLDQLAIGGRRSLAPLMSQIPVMSRVVVLTDLLDDADALINVAAQRTAAGGTLECVHIVASDEIILPPGAHLARDSEHPDQVQAMDAKAHAEYQVRFSAFRRDMAARWRASGAGYTEVRTDTNVARAIRELTAGGGRTEPRSGDSR